MRTPADVLTDLLRSDPAQPRVTFYEDTPGATAGERIDKRQVLANWVSKAANALQEEWDIAPGSQVHGPARALARPLLGAGGVVRRRLRGGRPVRRGRRARPPRDRRPVAGGAGGPAVLVTLAALARSAPDGAPPGVVDEARELATYADQFTPWEEPATADPALASGGRTAAYWEVVPDRGWPSGTRVPPARPGSPRCCSTRCRPGRPTAPSCSRAGRWTTRPARAPRRRGRHARALIPRGRGRRARASPPRVSGGATRPRAPATSPTRRRPCARSWRAPGGP